MVGYRFCSAFAADVFASYKAWYGTVIVRSAYTS